MQEEDAEVGTGRQAGCERSFKLAGATDEGVGKKGFWIEAGDWLWPPQKVKL